MHPLFAKYRTFKLNGQTYDLRTLEHQACRAIQHKKPHWEYSFFKFLTELFDDKDYITAYTSGTTAHKKVIYLSKAELILSAQRTIRALDLKPNGNMLLCLPCEYIAGKMMLIRALIDRHNLITVKPSLNPLSTSDKRLDFTALTPQQLINSSLMLQKHPGACILVGGAPVSTALRQQLSKFKTSRIYETFAMTETCSNIALRQISPTAEPYFKALEGIHLETNAANCLVLKYQVGEELKTVITRDIVQLHGQSRFEWLGRADLVINSGGLKHHPEYLEQKITQKFNYNLIVTSLPDISLGQKLVLMVEVSEGKKVNKKKLLNAINRHLEKYEKMHDLLLIPQFKRTRSNKIIRPNLNALIKNFT